MEQQLHDPELDRLERLAAQMDSAFRIPLTRIRVGWDSILGLIPGIGDAAALAPAGYILYRAHQRGTPKPVLARMAGNVALDVAVGAIPVVGDLFDVGFKANRRNVALLRKHHEETLQTKMASAPVPGEGHLSSHHPAIGEADAR